MAQEAEAEADLPFEDAAAAPLPEAPADTGEADDLHEAEEPAWPDPAADLDLTGGPALSGEAEAALSAALSDDAQEPLPDMYPPAAEAEDWPTEAWPAEDLTEEDTSLADDTVTNTPPAEMAAGLAAAGLAAAANAPAAPPRPEPELRRRSVDEAVLSVLREEAEREARARRAQTPAMESQPELGLQPAPAPPPAAPAPEPDATERGATLRGEDPELEAEIAAANRPPRRELLPDIEEINSTLRATSERGREPAAVDAPETLRRRRSGFRLGFGLSLGTALVLLGLYLGAPRLSAQVPSVAPALTGYVSAVDRGRIWLDRTLAARIDAMTAAE